MISRFSVGYALFFLIGVNTYYTNSVYAEVAYFWNHGGAQVHGTQCQSMRPAIGPHYSLGDLLKSIHDYKDCSKGSDNLKFLGLHYSGYKGKGSGAFWTDENGVFHNYNSSEDYRYYLGPSTNLQPYGYFLPPESAVFDSPMQACQHKIANSPFAGWTANTYILDGNVYCEATDSGQVAGQGAIRPDCPAYYSPVWDSVSSSTCWLRDHRYGDDPMNGYHYVYIQVVGIDPEENTGDEDCQKTGGTNPINLTIGNKYQQEIDYVGNSLYPVSFKRSYNSYQIDNTENSTGLGKNWLHNYAKRVSIVTQYEKRYARVVRGDGKAYKFTGTTSSNIWTPRNSHAKAGRLIENSDGTFEYYPADDSIENYDSNGLLMSVQDLNGRTHTLTYGGNNRLSRVTDSVGDYIEFTYDQGGRIYTIKNRAEHVWTYSYDTDSNLVYVDNPDSTRRQYHYEDINFPNALTGITDERNVRFATYAYDANGRATLSTHANNVNRKDISYNGDNTRTIVNSKGVSSLMTTIESENISLVSSIIGPSGCASCGDDYTQFSYDANNNVIDMIKDGIATKFGAYDANGNPGYKELASGTRDSRRTDYTYDSRFFSKVATTTEPSVCPTGNRLTTYTYDVSGNLTNITIDGFTPSCTAVSRTVSLKYQGPLNQVSEIDGPLSGRGKGSVSDITRFNYYPDSSLAGNNRARLKQVVDAEGNILRDNIQYSTTGKIISEDRPNGLTLIYTYYSGNDRLESLTETAESVSRTTLWTYLATGEVESITIADGTMDSVTFTLSYDDARRLTRITDRLGNYIEYTLDTEGNLESEKIYDNAGFLKKSLTQTFDIYNRLNLSRQVNESVDSDYASNGLLDKQIDGKGAVTEFGYDSLNRLVTVTQDLGGTDISTADALTQLGYDANGNLSTVVDPNNGSTTYEYDDLGNLLKIISPDTGTTSYNYDLAGNLTSQLDAKGQSISYEYDSNGRLTKITTQEGDAEYFYDNCLNGIARLCAVNTSDTAVSFSYDGFGDVIAHQGITYSYDAAARVKTITYPSGAIVAYSYDPMGNVNKVELTQGVTTSVLASNIRYEPFGPLSNLTFGNNLSLSQQFDAAYRITNQSIPNVLDISYSNYDANGNILQRDIDGLVNTFNYDSLNRLDVASGVFGDRDYDYDKNNNRVMLIEDSVITSYVYESNSNRISNIGASSIQLDANGNTTVNGDWNFSYTSTNRLKEIRFSGDLKGSYVYNGLGQRVQKNVSGTSTSFSYGLNGELLSETNENGSINKEYVYLNNQPIAFIVSVNEATEPPPAEEIIVDNGGAGTSSTGTWSTQSNKKDYSSDYLVANGNTNSTYRWSPVLSEGSYDVYAWWVANRKNSKNVPVTISHNGSTSTSSLDQTTGGGNWVLVGNYDFLGDGSEYIEINDANGKTLADAVKFVKVGGTAPPATVTTDVYYVHNDHLGTPQRLSDSNGVIVWSANYNPFGNATVNEDPDNDGNLVTFNKRFPGQYFDLESGLYYNYFRDYDPGTGRYVQSDPIGLLGGLNTYAYALTNPLNYFDPLGLNPWADTGWRISFGLTAPFWNKAAEGTSFEPSPEAQIAAGGGTIGMGFAIAATSTAVSVPYWAIASAASGGWQIGSGVYDLNPDFFQNNVGKSIHNFFEWWNKTNNESGCVNQL